MAENEANQQNSSDRMKRMIIILLLLVLIVIAVLIGIIVYLLKGEKAPLGGTPDQQTEKPYSSVVTPDNIKEVAEEIEANEKNLVPIGYYEVKMNTEWRFPDGDSVSSNAYVENAENNQLPVYFTIVPADDETERVLYTSPLLMVGSHLDEIKLDEHLEQGTYDCVLTYHLMDANDREQSTVSISLSIIIEN